MDKPVGVIGSGSFGIALSRLLSENCEVWIYARRPEVRQAIEARQANFAILPNNVKAIDSLEKLAQHCTLIFPVVPSRTFREMMRELSPFLHPYHLLIHGTKGLDTSTAPDGEPLRPQYVRTMSQIIEEESVVCRVGCLSGPNLSAEIMEGQPAATLISSKYNEVIKAGQQALRSRLFQVYGAFDIMGAELAGALKNVIALAAGILGGRGLGKNVWALLIARGLSEMIHVGKALGADVKAFLGIAGIGDLVATAGSERSRNYMVGKRIAQGETLDKILSEMSEVAEGVQTLDKVRALGAHLNITVPITEIVHRVIFKGMDPDKAIEFLMHYPYAVDVDYL